jgi:hypothetical protein
MLTEFVPLAALNDASLTGAEGYELRLLF